MNQQYPRDVFFYYQDGHVYANGVIVSSREALKMAALFNRVDIILHLAQYADSLYNRENLYKSFLLAVKCGNLDVIRYFVEYDYIQDLHKALDLAETEQQHAVIDYLRIEIYA